MNETSINFAVVPVLIYRNPNQAPNTTKSKTALAVSGKYWKYTTLQLSKKKCLFCHSDSLLIAIFSYRWMIFGQSWGPTIHVLISLLHLLAAFRLLLLALKIRSTTLNFVLKFSKKSIPETATWSSAAPTNVVFSRYYSIIVQIH